MKLVLVFLALAFTWCDASTIVCQSYNENEKLLLQSCDNYKDQSPKNCSSNPPAVLDSSNVRHLKIQGCDSNIIRDANEKYEKIENIDISHADLNSLGNIDKPFADLAELNATINALSKVPKEIINKCPKLETLDLSYNHLERINHGDFEQSQKLKTIDLSSNQLIKIHTDAFANLSDLQVIRLDRNQLSSIPPLRFRNHPIEVGLQKNGLTEFNCTSIAAMSPATVYLSWRDIKSFLGDQGCGARKFRIKQNDGTGYEGVSTVTDNWELMCNDQSFHNLQHFVAGASAFENIHDILPLISATVWTLDLSDNNIGFLNQTIFERFRTLQELRLSNTELTTFDVSALNTNNQKSLSRLDISYNHLTEIEHSRTLGYYSNLTEFNAAGNQIQNASDVIGNLPKNVQQLNMAHSINVGNLKDLTRFSELTHLDLSYTHLNIFDFPVFERLTNFDISGNDLSKANFATLTQLNQLKEFRAANCHIQNVPDMIQFIGHYVEKLDLSGNLATRFAPKSFEKLTNLKELSIGDMQMQDIDAGIFEHLTNLTYLNMTGNKLEDFDVGRFPRTLQQFHLHGNNLKRIVNLDRKHFPALKVLSVSQNLLECDYLDQLHDQFTDTIILIDDPQHNPFEQRNGTCHSKLSFIILCIVAVLVILLIAICVCFLCRKRLCKKNY